MCRVVHIKVPTESLREHSLVVILTSHVYHPPLYQLNPTYNLDADVLRVSSACKDVRLVPRTSREKRWKSDVLIFSLDFLLR